MTDIAVDHHRIPGAGATLHVATAGTGEAEPVLLLHGWPQTWLAWRRLAPLLDRHRLVMPDLPGLGGSDPGSRYDKASLARHVVAVVDALGIDRLFVVGHDWGGVVAFHAAGLLGDRALGLVVLDVTIPNDQGAGPDIAQGGRRWHHAFHRSGLADTLIPGREREYYTWFYRTLGASPDVIDDPAIDAYVDAYRAPGRTAAGLEYYKSLPADVAAAGPMGRNGLRVPVLALGGDSGWGRGDEVRQSLSFFAADTSGGALTGCGHWIPEERPEELARRLTGFFAHCRAVDGRSGQSVEDGDDGA